jgi:hypothetical protein
MAKKAVDAGGMRDGDVNMWGTGGRNQTYGYWESPSKDPTKKRFTVDNLSPEPYTGQTEYGYATDGKLGGSTKPNWVDGTATQGQAQINRRAPITPLPGAILVQEDDASLDTKRPLGSGDSTRSVIDRTTGRTRTEEEEENRLRGAVLLR